MVGSRFARVFWDGCYVDVRLFWMVLGCSEWLLGCFEWLLRSCGSFLSGAKIFLQVARVFWVVGC